jgi:hypothetical protein
MERGGVSVGGWREMVMFLFDVSLLADHPAPTTSMARTSGRSGRSSSNDGLAFPASLLFHRCLDCVFVLVGWFYLFTFFYRKLKRRVRRR